MRTVDARGHRCPTPTLKLGRALREAAPGEEIELLATDPMARIDVPHFVGQGGHHLLSVEERDGVLAFRVTRSASAPTG